MNINNFNEILDKKILNRGYDYYLDVKKIKDILLNCFVRINYYFSVSTYKP